MLALRHAASGCSLPAGKAALDQTELLEEHIPGLRRFARALLHGDRQAADDLVQDSLERALSRWHQRRREGDLHAVGTQFFVTDSSPTGIACGAAASTNRCTRFKRQTSRVWRVIRTERSHVAI